MTQGAPSAAMRVAPLPVSGIAHAYRQGVLAGVFGAALLAVWFFYLDWGRGRPLYTPTLMATALLQAGSGLPSPETLAPSLRLTLLFTVVHGTVFILLGVAAAHLLYVAERGRGFATHVLAMLVVFSVLGLGFFGFALTFAPVAVNVLDVQDVLLGNGIAAAGMVVHLLRHY